MYTLLAVFPALGALVSIYGMFATPADAIRNMKSFSGVMPRGRGTWNIFNQQLQTLPTSRMLSGKSADSYGSR